VYSAIVVPVKIGQFHQGSHPGKSVTSLMTWTGVRIVTNGHFAV